MVDRRMFFNNLFNDLSVSLQYTLSFEIPGFGLKRLFGVMPKRHSSKFKATLK